MHNNNSIRSQLFQFTSSNASRNYSYYNPIGVYGSFRKQQAVCGPQRKFTHNKQQHTKQNKRFEEKRENVSDQKKQTVVVLWHERTISFVFVFYVMIVV